MIKTRDELREDVRGGEIVSWLEILKAVRVAFHLNWFQYCWLWIRGAFCLCDKYYKKADEVVITSILDKDKTDLERWVAELHDCDDFSFRLMGVFHSDKRTVAMPIFLLLVWWRSPTDGKRVYHSLLCYYYKGRILKIEPQTDIIRSIPREYHLARIEG